MCNKFNRLQAIGPSTKSKAMLRAGDGLWAMGYGQWNSSKAKEWQAILLTGIKGMEGMEGLWAMEQFKGKRMAGDGDEYGNRGTA